MKHNPIIEGTGVISTIPATESQLASLGITTEQITAGEARFDMVTVGPWNVCLSITAIVEDAEYVANGAKRDVKRFYPARKCSNPKQMGYDMEGTISLNGVRRHVFTSSQLFELPDGRLIDVSTLHTCRR